MRRRGRIALVSVAAALSLVALPASASASTLASASGNLTYTAAAGETNNVTVSQTGSNYDVNDPGATITPSAPCATVSTNEATCPTSGVTSTRLLLGNMDDTGVIAASVNGTGVSGDLRGGDGNDTMTGGPNITNFLLGDDSVAGNDTLTGGSLNDRLSGSGGNDVESGGAGSDLFDGGAGTDVMNGDAGNDQFLAGTGADGPDVINGGPGADEANYSSRVADLSLSLDGVANDGEAGEGDNVAPDVEELLAGLGNDTVTGNSGFNELLDFSGGNNTVSGLGGNDLITTQSGNDALSGGPGNDRLSPGAGQDSVSGDEGDDTILNNDGQPDALSGGPGTDLLDDSGEQSSVSVTLDGVANDGIAGENDNAMADVEDVDGSSAADTLVGNGSANELDGGDGNDVIRGLGGDDGLDGGRGDDSLDGGPGTDLLSGDSGADALRTRDGSADESSCGAGVDTVLADQLDPLRPDCEQASTGLAFETKQAKVAPSGKAKVKLACPAVEGIACDGTLVLRRAARKGKLARAKVSIPSGKTRAVKLKVKGLGAKRTAATAKATMTDASGAKVRSSERLVLVR
ncbi:MAG TPA: calcium-binding protein [Acidimicrobiia bacterium]|nr:calcium-binding protein [Acidimicrobiia bacterium]